MSNRRRITLCSLLLASVLSAEIAIAQPATVEGRNAGASPQPLLRAHAHNDYLHDRPLLDALEQGFCSVEADIFLVRGDLRVAHTVLSLPRAKTLAELYLDPLSEQIRKNGGQVYANGPEFTLLIDIKTDGGVTYQALHKLLGNYRNIVTHEADGKLNKRAVNVIISGNRDSQIIEKSSPRYAGIDGRLSDLENDVSAELIPLISDNWTKHFRWNGKGDFPDSEKQRLVQIVTQTHAKGRRLRFWAVPDKLPVWKVLHECGVDLINTDDLNGLREFLNQINQEDRR
jgi:hypothetical protein